MHSLAMCHLNAIGTKQDVDKAYKVIDDAIDINPEEPMLYDLKGVIPVAQEKIHKAQDMYKKVIGISPTYYTFNNSTLPQELKKNGKLTE